MWHAVVVAHGVVLVLCGGSGIVVYVIQQYHRRVGGPCKQLADNTLVSLLPEGNFQIVDAEIHHYEIWLVHQHIGHGTGNAVQRICAADAAVDVVELRLRKGIHEPLVHPERIGVAGWVERLPWVMEPPRKPMVNSCPAAARRNSSFKRAKLDVFILKLLPDMRYG